MRLSPTLLALALSSVAVSAASAQGTYSCPDALELVSQDGGLGGFSFKTGNPSGPSDWFSVDFNNELQSCKIAGVAVQLSDLGNPNKTSQIGRIGIYPDNLILDPTGAVVDVGNPIVEVGTCSTALGAGCNTTFYFSIPLLHLADENVHVSYNHKPGDSSLFVCTDGTSPASGRSSLSTNGYATPGPVLGVDWKLGVGVVPKVVSSSNQFLINGSLAANVTQLDNVALSFYGPEGSNFAANPGVGLCAFAFCPGGFAASFVTPILPIGFNGVGSDDTTICGAVACTVPAFPLIPFCVLYLDATDTKPNGAAKLKTTNVSTLSIAANPTACGFCFGQKDDGAVGLGAWTTAIPAGSRDWFNVRHGTPSAASGVMTLTGVEVATVVSGTTCGGIVGNSAGGWDEVGIYAADLVQDSTGGTPDVANPIASVAPVAIANGTLNWGYPATFVSMPGIGAVPPAPLHAAVKWDTGDSCLRVTADDSTSVGPDPCGTIPSSTSYSTLDGYATNAVAFSQVNWLLKIDWK